MTDAGTWWLKGAWLETGLGAALLSVIETACQRYRTQVNAPALRIVTHPREVLVRKNETLVFLPLFENMTRPRHLDSYADDGLGWLTEASQVYRAVTIERYLSDLTCLGIAAPLGQAFARCYWRAWYQHGDIADAHVFYVDMHDKVIWTNKPSPVSFVSAMHEVHPCLKQTFVHGRGGHALFCLTYAADVHLNEVVVTVAQALEQAIGCSVIQVIVTDREGLSAEVIRTLALKNKAFVTLLKSNQYAGEADPSTALRACFVRRGRFRQIKDPRTGQTTHRVADADFQLAPDLAVRAVTHKLETKVAQLAEQAHRLEKRTARYEQHVTQLLRPARQGGPPSTRRAAQRQQQLQELRQRYHQHLLKQVARQAKLERELEAHRQEQTRVTQELTQLNPQATFFEVDTEKDQIMAHLRIALHNSALWARDHYFGTAYRHATPLTLWRTFFNQAGFYREMSDRIVITLKLFRNTSVQHEAVQACERFNERRITTHSGKRIEMRVAKSI